MESPELAALVARARTGDRAALESVLAAVAPSVHRFGLRMCKSATDAEDVLQETLLAILNHLPEFEGRASLSSWAFSLTRSACARKRRGLKNRPPVSDEHLGEEADVAPSPEARAADRELASALSTALGGLSDDHREVVLLRDVEGLSAPETASALGISVDAVKSRLHRAREALRAALRPVLEPSIPRGPGCPDIVALWSEKMDGDLSPRDCAAMERHIEGCASCGAACDALKRTLLACQRVQSGPVPADVQRSVKAALDAWTARAPS